ncbi:hypothetical protein EXIGLDRAFT_737493 [Exidia glandulosa HHB12029]|uniref:Uncharacterized protein n=1 Tax=Exidia glandulosa HHB12029 TaxID=1314781 RepID=A0A165IY18_EXIGL|nr:hypothetical protein EXIGLDRAFT_737493 [Exidia glandulosa HHB12029]
MSIELTLPRDFDDGVRHAASLGWQIASIAAPPAYIAFVLARRGRSALSLNSVFRASWIGGVAGTGVGALAGYTRLKATDATRIHEQAMLRRYDASKVRRDDFSMVGAALGAVLAPALFWNYARAWNMVLGGAGLGCATGVLVHLGKGTTGKATDTTERAPTQPS